MRDYLPIAEHGVIGDLRTVALVGTDGTIDWFCLPRFDSPSVFAAILDKDKGGYFRIAPSRMGFTPKQLYFPDTNVLITRFLTAEGWGRCRTSCRWPAACTDSGSIRRVLAVRGLHFRVEVEPRFDYARATHTVESSPHGAVFGRATSTWPCRRRSPRPHRERRDRGVRPSAGESRSRSKQSPTRWRRSRAASRRPRSSSRPRSRTGAAGSRPPATRGAGGRWSTVRH